MLPTPSKRSATRGYQRFTPIGVMQVFLELLQFSMINQRKISCVCPNVFQPGRFLFWDFKAVEK